MAAFGNEQEAMTYLLLAGWGQETLFGSDQ